MALSALVETTDAALLRRVAATLAALAVGARRTAGRLAAALPGGEGRLARFGDGAALAGGLLLVAVRLVLLQAAWTPPLHPLR